MRRARLPLTAGDREAFDETGTLYIEGFYDTSEVLDLQRAIYRLITVAIATRDLAVGQEPFSPEEFDSGLAELLVDHRSTAGLIYDAIKKLPSYVRLASSPRHDGVTSFLLGSDFVGFANRGYGVRMDNPNEDDYLTQLHQDYTSQLCSPSGLVFWSPLRRVTQDMGPVAIFEGSHRQGILPIRVTGAGSYGLQLRDPEAAVRGCPVSREEIEVGDAVVIHALTLHESTANRADRTRWSMISRFFDLNEPIGATHGWKGGLQEGNAFGDRHPDLTDGPI